MKHSLVFLIFGILTGSACAQSAVVFDQVWDVGSTVPDNDSNGLTSVQTVALLFSDLRIESLTVTFETTGGWNGDLYAYLTHDAGFSVLLNRPGRTLTNPDGSGGATGGMRVTFADSAATDIHEAPAALPSGFITGQYQPDARATDPASTLDTDARTQFLSSFNGLNPEGQWVLFVADTATGDQASLARWGLTITAAIPEPSSGLLLTLTVMGAARRRKNPLPRRDASGVLPC